MSQPNHHIQTVSELMKVRFRSVLPVCLFMMISVSSLFGQATDSSMSFFITGRSLETGGNFGGLSGADAHCQQLADSVGVGNRVWRAYLSTQAVGEEPAVNARDRIGTGPWFNANKVMIAADLAMLHDTANSATINATTGLTHRGATVSRHDIVTGTKIDGMAPAAGADSTCAGWTSSTTGGALVGHHNRSGISSNICQTCWNLSHRTNGCTQANLEQGGGDGYFYCFAADNPATGVLPGSENLDKFGRWDGIAPYVLGRVTGGGRPGDVVYRFELRETSRVEVAVYDAEGRKKVELQNDFREAGHHMVRWDGRDAQGAPLPAGVYLIVMRRS